MTRTTRSIARRLWASAAIAILASAGGGAATRAAAQQQAAAAARESGSVINIPFTHYQLPNGLNVILSPDHTTPTVAISVMYHVGSKNEVVGRTGFAHLFEHVMFTGSGHIPYGAHDKYTEGVGGFNNGGTDFDATRYYETVPSNYLESVLWLESDRMGFLLDALDLAKLNAQRDIVKNERRERVDNQPYGHQSEIVGAAIFPKGHPYSWPVIGSMTDLSAASEKDVKDFFRLYYAPNNATLSIAGDIDTAQAKAWVAKYFGDIPRGKPIVRPRVPAVTLSEEKRLVAEDRVQIPRLWITWPTVGVKHPDDHVLDVLASILAPTRTARLTKELVFAREWATGVGAAQATLEDGGEFSISITPRPGHTLTELELATDSILDRIKREGPTEAEVTRAKAGLELDYVDGLQVPLEKAQTLANGLVFFGDAAHYRTEYRDAQTVTAADVKRVANKYLTKGRVVLSIVPLGKKEEASKPDRSVSATTGGPQR